MIKRSTLSRLTNSAIDPRIHIFRRIFASAGDTGELQVDAYALQTERFLIFCDTLLCPADAAFIASQFIEDEGHRRQWLVVNSHSDWDHVWGNAYFRDPAPGIPTPPIIGHRINAERQRSPEAQAMLQIYQQTDALFAESRYIAPTLTFEQDMIIDGGDLTLELFHAPGHCQDHIAGWLPQIQTLLAFDAVEWPFPSIESAEAVPQHIATLRRFLDLKPRFVLYQHGTQNGVDDAWIIQRCLDYILTIEQRCQTLLSTQRISAEEIEQGVWAARIGYRFEEVSVGLNNIVTFYRDTHEENVRNVLRYILQQ